jgi:hypothetical protein
LSQDAVDACSSYLGVPGIVIKIVSGAVRMRDFILPIESEETALQRSLRELKTDLQLRASFPGDIDHLPVEAQRTLALLYGSAQDDDRLRIRRLPDVMHWLQRAAGIHDEHEVASHKGIDHST